MNPRQLLKATLLILGILTLLTTPASAAAVTYTLDAANATNITLQNGIWIPASGTASFTIPICISTTDYVYGYTAQNTTASLKIAILDKTEWVSEQTAGKLSAGICTGTSGTEITGTNRPLANITVNTSGITDGTYRAGILLESAYSRYPITAVSLPTLNKETYTQTFTIRIGNPTPAPTKHPGGGGVIHTPTPTPTPTPELTPAPTPTSIDPGTDSGENQPAADLPIAIAIIIGGITALIGCILLLLIIFPRVSLNYSGRTIKFRSRIGKSVKAAIAKHAPDLPCDGWYLNEAKTELIDPDARIWRNMELWHRR